MHASSFSNMAPIYFYIFLVCGCLSIQTYIRHFSAYILNYPWYIQIFIGQNFKQLLFNLGSCLEGNIMSDSGFPRSIALHKIQTVDFEMILNIFKLTTIWWNAYPYFSSILIQLLWFPISI